MTNATTLNGFKSTMIAAFSVLSRLMRHDPKSVTVSVHGTDLSKAIISGWADGIPASVDAKYELRHCNTNALKAASGFVTAVYDAMESIAQKHGTSVATVTVDASASCPSWFGIPTIEPGRLEGKVGLSNGHKVRFFLTEKKNDRVQIRVGDNKKTIN